MAGLETHLLTLWEAAPAVVAVAANGEGGVASREVLQFLQTMAMVMIVAGGVTIIFHRLKQPVVLGYILAGLIIGPHTPYIPLRVHTESVHNLEQLGLIFLMLSLGLHFSIKQLGRVGRSAFIAASLEIVLMAWIGYEIGGLFGWEFWDRLFLGAILSISSTTIIIKALEDLGLTRRPFSELVFGILIVEDILAIAIIALLSSLATTGGLQVETVGTTLGKLAVFLTTILVVGLLLVPKMLDYVHRFRSNEMMLVAVLGLTFGVSLLAVQLNYSVALGAFLIGAIIAETRHHRYVEHLIAPLRDMFSAVFFVAIGMLIDPSMLREYATPIVVITLAVIVGKVISCSLGPLLAGNSPRESLRVGMSLAQIGEFSFIIAALGLQLGKTSDFLYPIAVTVSALTTLSTPYLIRSSDPVGNWIGRVAPQALLGPLRLYHLWISSRHRGDDVRNQVRTLLRKWALQMALNVALLTGFFAIAAYLARPHVQDDGIARPLLPAIPGWPGGTTTLLWLGAMLICLPLLIATLRKLRAAAMLIAEVSVAKSDAREQTVTIRAIVTNTILMAGSLLLGLWVLILSSTMLSSRWALLAGAVIVAGVAMLAWRWCVKIYSRAQVALRETLAAEYADEPSGAAIAPALPSVLDRAVLEMVEFPAESPFAGRTIRDIPLRSAHGGASIVAIERLGEPIINPPADERVEPGDHVLLLGLPAQVAAARLLLTRGEVAVLPEGSGQQSELFDKPGREAADRKSQI